MGAHSRLLCLLAVAALAAAAAATFRPEEMAKFRNKYEDRIKKVIIDAESKKSSNMSSEESGERSELAGKQRGDDSIQRAALARLAEKERVNKERAERLEKERESHSQQPAAAAAAALESSLGQQLEGALLLGGGGKSSGPFDYLMFTMIYPTATCMADDDQMPGSCEIPAGTAEWTIHGLWPNYKDGSYPQFCDHQKFDAKQVEKLHEQMRVKWPNLFPKTPEDQLWSHEWEKHGTCSMSDPLLEGQFRYFNMSLFLLDHIDLRTRMEQKGISPRAAPYERDTLQKALDEVVGHRVQMYCLQDKKTHESLLADIRVCMNRELRPIDCPVADVHPFVQAGSVTPVDQQPLPVPKRCADSLYYIPAGTDLAKTIDVQQPVNDAEDEESKKLSDKDDYDYGDEEKEGEKGEKKEEGVREKEETERTQMLEKELMDGLKMKHKEYEEHRHEHMQQALQALHDSGIDVKTDDGLQLEAQFEKAAFRPAAETGRDFAEVAEMARKFQEHRARVLAAGAAAEPRRATIYLGIACLSLYLLIIIAFFAGRRGDRQSYGRLEYSA